MKNLNAILSKTVLIGILTLSISCVDKKKEDSNGADNLHDQEMHDEQMDHDGEMHDEGEMHHDGEVHDEMGHDGENHDMAEMGDMTVTESQMASSVIDNYLSVKNALANDDKDAASKAGENLGKSLASFDVNAVESSKQQDAIAILDRMKTHAEHISKMDIAHQRTHFAEINTDMRNLLAITGSDRTLYVQYCPMYADNTGGAWLSDSKDIKNPLFGSKMLKCGAVKQTIVIN